MTPTQRPDDLDRLKQAIQVGDLEVSTSIMFRLKWVALDEAVGVFALEQLRQPGLTPAVKSGLLVLVATHFRKALLVAAQLATETQDDADTLFRTLIELMQVIRTPDWVAR